MDAAEKYQGPILVDAKIDNHGPNQAATDLKMQRRQSIELFTEAGRILFEAAPDVPNGTHNLCSAPFLVRLLLKTLQPLSDLERAMHMVRPAIGVKTSHVRLSCA